MQSLDSRVVQLLSVTQIKTGSTQRAFAQPLFKLNTTPEPGHIPAGGCHQGKQAISSFPRAFRATTLGNHDLGTSYRTTSWGFLLAHFPQCLVAESSSFVLTRQHPKVRNTNPETFSAN